MATEDSTPSRVRFTAARVRGFACPADKSEATYWDDEALGLGLRVRPSGAKTYLFQFRIHGKAGRVTIGSPDTWGIDQARAEARRLKVLVDTGTDPRQEREDKDTAHTAKLAEKAAHVEEVRRQAVTLGELWPRYIEARRDDWGKHSLNDHIRAMQAPGLPRARSKELTQPGALHSLKDARLPDLTPERLEAWLRTETKTRPTVSALAYRLLRAFLNWADTHPGLKGLARTEATAAGNVKKAVPTSKAKKDALEREQLGAWFDEVRRINNSVIANYLQALLLTGARPESMRALRWQDVDFKWNRLTIRDKAESYGGQDGTRTIPLTPYVASLLHDLKRRAPSVRNINDPTPGSLSPWVFASPTSATGYITEPSRANAQVCIMAGIPHVSPQGLRRSFGTLSEWVETPAGIAAQIMGHAPSATAEKHFRVRPIDLLRSWHTKIESWILEQAGIEQPAVIEAAPVMRRVK